MSHLDKLTSVVPVKPEAVEFVNNTHDTSAIYVVLVVSEVVKEAKHKQLSHVSRLNQLTLAVTKKLVRQHKHWFTYHTCKKLLWEEIKRGNLTLTREEIFQIFVEGSFGPSNLILSEFRRLQGIAAKWAVGK